MRKLNYVGNLLLWNRVFKKNYIALGLIEKSERSRWQCSRSEMAGESSLQNDFRWYPKSWEWIEVDDRRRKINREHGLYTTALCRPLRIPLTYRIAERLTTPDQCKTIIKQCNKLINDTTTKWNASLRKQLRENRAAYDEPRITLFNSKTARRQTGFTSSTRSDGTHGNLAEVWTR